MLLQTNIEARNNNYVTIARHLKFTRKQLFETQSESAEPDDQNQVTSLLTLGRNQSQ